MSWNVFVGGRPSPRPNSEPESSARLSRLPGTIDSISQQSLVAADSCHPWSAARGSSTTPWSRSCAGRAGASTLAILARSWPCSSRRPRASMPTSSIPSTWTNGSLAPASPALHSSSAQASATHSTSRLYPAAFPVSRSGITVSAHRGGRMIDQNTPDEGPFGPDRTGWLPVRQLIWRCFSGEFNEKQLDRMVFGEGGLFAYLGTRDLQEVERRIDAGDPHASVVYDAMVYQIAKEIGAMAAVLQGQVDAVLLTGGMAHSERLVNCLRSYIDWIAPVSVYPGEDELRALAEGVFRVLNGEEQAKTFRVAQPSPARHRDR